MACQKKERRKNVSNKSLHLKIKPYLFFITDCRWKHNTLQMMWDVLVCLMHRFWAVHCSSYSPASDGLSAGFINRKCPLQKHPHWHPPSGSRPFFTWYQDVSNFLDLVGGCLLLSRCRVSNCCLGILFSSPGFNKGERMSYRVPCCCVLEAPVVLQCRQICTQ